MYNFCTKKISFIYVLSILLVFFNVFAFTLAFAQGYSNANSNQNLNQNLNKNTGGIQGLQSIYKNNQNNQNNQINQINQIKNTPLPQNNDNTAPDMNQPALGQLNQGGQTAFNTFTAPNLLQQIDSQNQKLFSDKIKIFLEKAEKLTLFIFYGLVLFAILANALMHIIKGASFKSFSIDFLLILFFANFWQLLISNWQGIHQNILNFLNTQGFEIKAQTYQDWLALLFEYTQRVLNLIDHNVNQTLVVLAFFLPVLYLWVRWLVLYIATVVQAVVIAQLMVILFAFAPIAPHYAKKPLAYTIGSVIKIILLQIMAVSFAELVAFYLEQPLDMAQVLIIFIIVYLLLMLAQHLEKLLDQVFNTSSFSTQINTWQRDLQRQWQVQLNEIKAMKSNEYEKSTKNTRGEAANSSAVSNMNAGIDANRVYQIKQERALRTSSNSFNALNAFNDAEKAANAPKPAARFEQNNPTNPTNLANGMNQAISKNGLDGMQYIQKQVWQVKLTQQNQGKNQQANQQKTFGVRK